MKTLHLNLIKKWYDMILSGEKKEEYREITDYWVRRLVFFRTDVEAAVLDEFITDLNNPYKHHAGPFSCMNYFYAYIKKFDNIHFKNGMGRTGKPAPCFDIEFRTLKIGLGHPKWGAEPGKYYFILGLGEILKRIDDVSLNDVIRVTNTLFHEDSMVLTAVGPITYKQLEKAYFA